MKAIYIDKMPNDLDQYLRAGISKRFNGTITVVLEAGRADAVLPPRQETTDTTKATVSLVDASRKTVLWSAAASDRKRLTLDIGHGGEKTVAAHLIAPLKKAMQSP